MPPPTKLVKTKQKAPHSLLYLSNFSSLILEVWFKASGTASLLDPLRYTAFVPSHGDHAITIPQDQSLHALQQVRDQIDIKVSHTKAQDVGVGGS